jgi:hypothetical protein
VNGCLRCIALGVDDRVALFYAVLGFEPWDVFANRRYAENARHMRDAARQTGRTVHGVIEALAECHVRGANYIAINNPTIRLMAMGYAAKLGVTAKFIATARGLDNAVTYEDHYHG